MSTHEMELFLVQWMNEHAVGQARRHIFGPGGGDDTTLVMLAFNLKELAKDLSLEVWRRNKLLERGEIPK